MQIKITANERGNPPGKVADAEIIFEPTEGPLSGLKLIGFSIWERRGRPDDYNVTFPARQYSINGERRSFALLRPHIEVSSSNAVRDAIIDAYRATIAPPAAEQPTAPQPTTATQTPPAVVASATTTAPGDDVVF